MVPSTLSEFRRSQFVRDAAVATAVLIVLYLLAPVVRIQPLQIPAYLLIVGFDMLEGVFGPVYSFFDVVFALYLVYLGVLGAGVAHTFRSLAESRGLPAWRIGIAGALTIVAIIGLLFGAMVYDGSLRSEPIQILTGTVLVLLLFATLAANVLGVTSRLSQLLHAD